MRALHLKLKRGDSFYFIGKSTCGYRQQVTGKNQYGTFAKCDACDCKYELNLAAPVAINKPKRRTSK
jgi:hypothetical protein|tara:strand:+ start:329 stop:529 length:201 start_codon:yes stop_codon:yes gene_type:complete